MKKKQVRLCLAALLLAVLSAFSACASSSPSTVREEFEDNGENQPYSQQIPLEEMDFSVYDEYVDFAQAAIDLNMPKKMELPCDVSYYESPDDGEPVIILKKGTTVYINAYSGSNVGYGMSSWPAYEEGWRYAQPFSVSEDGNVKATAAGKYYVKTENLFEVAEGLRRLWKGSSGMTAKRFQKNCVMGIDMDLYLAGAFCSPDIEKYYTKREDIRMT